MNSRKKRKRIPLAQYFYCPKCKNWFIGSNYLQTVFKSYYGAWAANLVTHHRHCHIKSYNAACSNPYYRRRIPNWDYDQYKNQTNNRGKRQMIRALMKEKYSPRIKKKILNGFSLLQNNDGETELLIQKFLARQDEPQGRKTGPCH